VGKGFWERETLPKSIKIKNRIQNHKKTYSKPFKKLSHFPNHKKIVFKTIKKTISHFLNHKKIISANHKKIVKKTLKKIFAKNGILKDLRSLNLIYFWVISYTISLTYPATSSHIRLRHPSMAGLICQNRTKSLGFHRKTAPKNWGGTGDRGCFFLGYPLVI